MNYYAVIDTNVIVSSLLKDTSVPGVVVSKALTGPIVPLVNEEILEEYREVLFRNKFDLDEDVINTVINALRNRAVFLDRTETDEVFADEDDVVFYEIVMTARTAVPAVLVTGNKKHYPQKTFIVTPREMLEIIEKNSSIES